MAFGRPSRLAGFDYVGFYRYHVRVATWNRMRHFAAADVVARACSELLICAAEHDFAINAYCWMPDHTHILVSGTSAAAHLRTFVCAWKQRTGYAFAQRSRGARLWQPSYFERVLREDEANEIVARYILENPIRAGLANRIGDYPHAWCAGPLADLQR